MNIEINNYVKGSYTIENDKGEILAEFDNNITDLGMQLIAGHPVTASTYNTSPDNPSWTFGYFFNSMAAILNDNSVLVFQGSPNVPAGFPQYSNKVITRSDGMLQVDCIFKQKYAFSSDCIIKAIQTGALPDSYSNAILPTPLSCKKYDAITVTYVFQFVSDCNKVISPMNFVTNHANGMLMPANKTNVRTTPIWWFGNQGSGSNSTTIFAPLQFPAKNGSPAWAYDKIALYFYSDVDIYNSMTSTTAQLTAIPQQEYIANPPHILRKTVSSIKHAASGNTYSTSLRFIFEPGEWPTTAIGFSYIAMGSSYYSAKESERAKVGIFTALQTPYNPYSKSADMIVGIDYKFTWTRAA